MRRSPWQPGHSPPPGTCQHDTEKEIPVCRIDTYPKVREGEREKQASKLAKQLQQKHMAMPLQTSLDSPRDPGELAAWLDFSFV